MKTKWKTLTPIAPPLHFLPPQRAESRAVPPSWDIRTLGAVLLSRLLRSLQLLGGVGQGLAEGRVHEE